MVGRADLREPVGVGADAENDRNLPAAQGPATLAFVIGFLRTAISLLFLCLMVWCSFTVPLGQRTLAEHTDRIGETREARELIKGARGRINPVLDEAKARLLGEYVEAPTYSRDDAAATRTRTNDKRKPEAALRTKTSESAKTKTSRSERSPGASEPRLPGS